MITQNLFTYFEFFLLHKNPLFNIRIYFLMTEKLTTCDVYYDCWILKYYMCGRRSTCSVRNRSACTRTQSVCVLWVTLPEIIHRIPDDTWFIRKRTDYTGWIIIILYWMHIYHSSNACTSCMILHYYNSGFIYYYYYYCYYCYYYSNRYSFFPDFSASCQFKEHYNIFYGLPMRSATGRQNIKKIGI